MTTVATPEQDQAVCDRKIRYLSEQCALNAAWALSAAAGVALYAYRCRVCPDWHVTSSPGGTSIPPPDPTDPPARSNPARRHRRHR